MLIMNEKKEAEMILKRYDNTKCNISQIVSLLIRYHIQYDNMDKTEAINKTNEYVKQHRAGFSEIEWKSFENKVADNSHKRPLRVVDNIPVTRNEIDTIKSIQDKSLQKLAFTMLVVSKINMIQNGSSWINMSDNELFVLANKKCKAELRYKSMHELLKLGFFSLPKRIDRVAFKYEKIDTDSDVVANVTYLSDLGNWWEYINGAKYSICEECGRLYKPASSTQRYCFIHSAVYNKSSTCICVDCGREFQIEPGQIKRKRCECCKTERRLKQYRDSKNKK